MKATYRNSIRSKELIRKAIITLLDQEKSISEISVSDIVKVANINRGTFYNHYNNVIEVIDEIENEFEYTLFNNGRKELEYSIEIEKEGFKDSIEYEVNNKEYELTRVGDEYYVKVKEGRNFVDYAKFKKIINGDGSVIFELVN